jgi:hypothetical protein
MIPYFFDYPYNEMKYSLANKEFKKRNNIFGERRQENAVQEVGE